VGTVGQSTYDAVHGLVYVVSFPNNVATVWTLDGASLAVQSTFTPPLELFDLQYSPAQQALYGIRVTSRFGRELSAFDLPTNASTPLFTLPYMWYVNASTFAHGADVYYGLLNNFPGQPNSTLAQKLVTLDVSNAAAPVGTVYDLDATTGLTVHFLARDASGPSGGNAALYGLALSTDPAQALAAFVQFDAASGYTYKVVASVADVVAAGPLFAQLSAGVPTPLCAFLTLASAPGTPTLTCVTPGGAPAVVASYGDGVGDFSAATFLYSAQE
jgi:hypothetical protein